MKMIYLLILMFPLTVLSQEYIVTDEIVDGKLVKTYELSATGNTQSVNQNFTINIPLLKGDLPKLKCFFTYSQNVSYTWYYPSPGIGGDVFIQVGGGVYYRDFAKGQQLRCDINASKNFSWEVDFFPDENIRTFNFSNNGSESDIDANNSLGSSDEETEIDLVIGFTSAVSQGQGLMNSVNATITIELTYNTKDIALDSQLRLAQTIFDPDISNNPDPTVNDNIVDIVANKAYAIEISGNVSEIESGETIEADIIIEDLINQSEAYYQTVDLTIEVDKSFKKIVALPLAIDGNYRIRVEVDPADKFPDESDEENNISFSKNFLVRTVSPLYIGIVKISSPDCGSNLCYSNIQNTDFETIATNGNENDINNFFASNPGQTKLENLPITVLGSNIRGTSNETEEGLFNDYIELSKLVLNQQKRKIVAAVDQEYFNFHEGPSSSKNTVGLVLQNISTKTASVAWVTNGRNDTLFHELGHTFGANHQNFSDVNGYNNSTMVEIENAFSIMTDEGFNSPIWPTVYTYERSLYSLLAPGIDPPIIIVSGILDLNNNSITNFKVEEFESGLLSNGSNNSNYAVQTKNSSGNLISSISVPVDLQAVTDTLNNDGTITESTFLLNRVPFIVSIPQNQEISSISFTFNSIELENIQLNKDRFFDLANSIELKSINSKVNFFKGIILWFIKNASKQLDNAIEKGNTKKILFRRNVLKLLILRYLKDSEIKTLFIDKLNALKI